MTIKNIFTREVTDEVIARVDQLDAESQPLWGKMNVAQMLAHCSVAYEMVYEPERFPKPGFLMRFIIRLVAKPQVVTEKPYPKSIRTAPEFLVTDQREFDAEKQKLVGFIKRTQELGESHFDGKASHAFGNLSVGEWNNLFYKHIDHHLRQFGV